MNELYIIEDSVLKGLTEKGKRQGILVLPEGITDIRDRVFNKACVKEITFPSSLKHIPAWILMGHEELEKVTISKGTEKIMDNAFNSCSSLRDVTIPDSVTEIKSYAFKDCTSLKGLHVPESVNFIDVGVFCGCTALEEISIPDGPETIIDEFWGCESLRTITIPESVSWIDEGAFLDCIALTDIFINSDKPKLLDGVHIPEGCRIHRNSRNGIAGNPRGMDDKAAAREYLGICRKRFPVIVEIIEEYCSAGTEGESQYRTKEEVLDFALMLIENFGPYPSDGGLVRDAWDHAFEHWNEVCPPHPELKACGTDSMSGEDISEWFEKNSHISISDLIGP